MSRFGPLLGENLHFAPEIDRLLEAEVRALVVGIGVVVGALSAWAQSGDLRGTEIVGYHATAVSLATQKCGGGEVSGALRDLANMQDADFRFGMSRAIGDWSQKLSGDAVNACAALRSQYGPSGTVSPGAWVLPR